jgi:hypothetical protein
MSNVPRLGTLEVQQDLNYQRREWRAQRIAWLPLSPADIPQEALG